MVQGVLKSKEAMAAEGGDYKLLPEDEYIAEIVTIEVLKDQTSQYQPEKHDEWKVAFNLISFSNQEPIYFEDGSEPDPKRDIRLTAFVNPTKIGFSESGAASKARQFITAAYGVGVGVEKPWDTDEMIGNRLIIRNVHKPNREGSPRDRIDGFRVLRTRTTAAKAETGEVEAAAEAQLAKAKDTFNDDLAF